VVIELPEQLKVRPRVVKLEEESVTINLGDDIVEQSAAIEEQARNHAQSMESAQATAVASAKEGNTAAAEPTADRHAPESSAAASTVAAGGPSDARPPVAIDSQTTTMATVESQSLPAATFSSLRQFPLHRIRCKTLNHLLSA